MRNDFAAIILSHGRPHNIITIPTLRSGGYTGPIYIVIDDEDPTGDEYRERYGKNVITFSKDEMAPHIDMLDNFRSKKSAVYVRNAIWNIAKHIGVRYFIELDDDYTAWSYRWVGTKPGNDRKDFHGWKIKNLDAIFSSLVRFLETTGATTIALSQGGDHAGGGNGPNAHIRLNRKAMNSFVCDTTRPFPFLGTLNDDVNAYIRGGYLGRMFFTYTPLQLQQPPTQTGTGGMVDAYADSGTYVKTMYTVMLAPHCTEVRTMGRTDRRLHHHIRWDNAVPKIIHESHRKKRPGPRKHPAAVTG